VIPARGGSKRVPRKNVKLLGGVPMIAYSIEAALRSGVIDMVVVSTDDEDIATIARDHGATVPFIREPELADDHTPVSTVTRQMVAWLGERGEVFDMVAQLLPNCPLRTARDVRNSHQAFVAQPFAAQVSVTRYGWQNPWWALERDESGAARPLFADKLMQRSQDLPTLFCPTGAVWWVTTGALLEHGTFHLQSRALFELEWEHGVDIDDEADFALAEVLLSRRATTGDGA
jgi:N-acylneuraminate cytidylyltransferase